MAEQKILKGILHFHSETGTEGGYWAFQDECFITKATLSFFIYIGQMVYDKNNPKRKGKILENIEIFKDGLSLPYPDPMTNDPDYYASSLFCGENRGNREADKRLMKKYGFKIKYAAERMDERHGRGNWHLENDYTAVTADGTRWSYGGSPTTTPSRPYGISKNTLVKTTVEWEDGIVELRRLTSTLLVDSWSYEGLHILENGDSLTIFSKDHPECQDPMQIIWHGKIILKQHPLFTEHASGLWIHADQVNIKRDVWAKYFLEGYPAKLIKRKTN